MQDSFVVMLNFFGILNMCTSWSTWACQIKHCVLETFQVLSSRKVQLLLGYFVRCIRKAVKGEVDHDDPANTVSVHATTAHHSESVILELQPSERGLQGQIIESDLVLWTVGSKPLLPELEQGDYPYELPLNGRGQAETDETLQVKGHPRIFAVGDASALRDKNGKLLPATAQVIDRILFLTIEVIVKKQL